MHSRILVALLFAFAASTAAAQPKPALVQDHDAPGRNPFQQVMVNNDCGGQIACSVVFDPVPAGMRLVVTQVTVETSVSDVSAAVFVRVLNNLGSARAAFVVAGPYNARFATVPVVMYMNAGQVPSVQGSAVGGTYAGSFVITLVGHLVPL